MTRAELVQFLRRHRLAVQASVARGGAPQAAVVGCVRVSDFTRDPPLIVELGGDELSSG